MNSLQRDILEPLNGLIGLPLSKVVYHPLQSEASSVELAASEYIGGEVGLHFNGATPRYVSWAENSGWTTHFTVQVSLTSLFSRNALEEFDASDTDLWRSVIGKKLTAVECLGWEQSPHVLRFVLEDSTRLVGSSFKRTFGDGDDVYFCEESNEADLAGALVLWKSG